MSTTKLKSYIDDRIQKGLPDLSIPQLKAIVDYDDFLESAVVLTTDAPTRTVGDSGSVSEHSTNEPDGKFCECKLDYYTESPNGNCVECGKPRPKNTNKQERGLE